MPIVGCVARLSAEKGLEDLLQAARYLVNEMPDVRFVVIGEDDSSGQTYKRRLCAYATELGISNNVVFMGFRDDVPRLLVDLDVVALPSHTESLGLAILEAMAAGRIVVATSVGGIPEMIRDGQNGFMVPPEQPYALAQALMLALRLPPEKHLQITQEAQRTALGFDIKRQLLLLEEVYKGLVYAG
jgi:glycosyltransferase involved in cell wall biosynthesis